ncbi:MAG: hypothetical protein ACR2JG_00125 [Geodermatophilaceae bacterium]
MSIWPRRRPALPAHIRAWLEPEERVLTFATTPYGDPVVATPRGIWTAEPGSRSTGQAAEEPDGRLLAWEHIVTARWAGDVLTVTTAEEVTAHIMKRLPPVSFPLPEPADLPRVVRQRVDRSVAASHRQALSAGGTVLLVGRRVSGRDGLLWYAVFDRDSDAEEPEARREATMLLESAAAGQSGPPDTG